MAKDIEYAVDDASGKQQTFDDPNKAAGFAIALCLSDGRPHNIDVLIWSRKAAIAYRGSSDGGEEYDEDPDASVFERIEVSVKHRGRIA